MKVQAVALAVSLLVMPACAASQAIDPRPPVDTPPTPAPVRDILYARPFTLQTPYRNDWSKERELVSSGTLIVVEVDPAYVVPRNALEPVLYAGDVAVQQLNQGNRSGRVIGLVPGHVDLTGAPIWFGNPELPERVTKATVRSERALAEKANVRSFSSSKIAAVTGPAIVATDLAALLRDVAAELVEEFSPQEKQLADSWRLPVVTAPKRPY